MKSKKTFSVVISDSAKKDIKISANWYNKQKKGLGKKFTQNIKECIKIIQFQPRSFQVRYKNIRIGIPDKFPYLIVYNINMTDKAITVIGVFHSFQNPKKMMNKI